MSCIRRSTSILHSVTKLKSEDKHNTVLLTILFYSFTLKDTSLLTIQLFNLISEDNFFPLLTIQLLKFTVMYALRSLRFYVTQRKIIPFIFSVSIYDYISPHIIYSTTHKMFFSCFTFFKRQ